MSDEWEVVGDYVAEIVARAPIAMHAIVQDLRCEFAEADGARRAAASLFSDLLKAGALREVEAKEVWTQHESAALTRCVDLLSIAANVDMMVRQAKQRKKTSTIDHEKDREVALKAEIKRILKLGNDQKTRILEAAREIGVEIKTDVDKNAYYQRIKRIIADPKERVESAVLLGLQKALSQIQKPPAP